MHEKTKKLHQKTEIWTHLLSFSRQSFFKLGTRYSTVNFFFFNTSFGFWHLKTWTLKAPPWLKGQIGLFCFFFLNRKHRTVSRSLLAFICPNLNIKGSFPLQFPPFWLLNLLCDLCISLCLWPFLSVMIPETITGYPIQHKALNSSSHESYRS